MKPGTDPGPAATRGGRTPAARSRAKLGLGLLLAAWLVALAVPPILLLQAREGWLRDLEKPGQQENWDAFRRDMARQSGPAGPVQRKVPRSAEPPLRVWLRDYIGLAITAWLLFGGVLGLFISILLMGTARPVQPRSLPQDQLGRGGHNEEQNQRDTQNAQQGKHSGEPSRKGKG